MQVPLVGLIIKKNSERVYQHDQLALQNFLFNPIKNYLFGYAFEAGDRFY